MKNFSAIAAALVAVGVAAAGVVYVRGKRAATMGGTSPGTAKPLPWYVNIYGRTPKPPPVNGYAPPQMSTTAADVKVYADAAKQGLDLFNAFTSAIEPPTIPADQVSAPDALAAQLGAGATGVGYPSDLNTWT